MLINEDFMSDKCKNEILGESRDDLPYRCRCTSYQSQSMEVAQWHWNDAFELKYVYEGVLTCVTENGDVTAGKGEVIFIDRGVLHKEYAEADSDALVYSHLFDVEFLAGSCGSMVESKYFSPMTGCSEMEILHIKPSDLQSMDMVRNVVQAFEYAKGDQFGCELAIRNCLSNFWLGLFEYTKPLRKSKGKRPGHNQERIKKMVKFIRDNYGRKLSLNEISGFAGISTRECTRCFMKTLGVTPMRYLGEVRMDEAAGMLLSTGKSVTSIAVETGFDSLSYFSKVFNDVYGCSPREYRNRGKQGA